MRTETTRPPANPAARPPVRRRDTVREAAELVTTVLGVATQVVAVVVAVRGLRRPRGCPGRSIR